MTIIINQIIFVIVSLAAFLWVADYIRRKEEQQIKMEDEASLKANNFGINASAQLFGNTPVAAMTSNDGNDRKVA